MAEAPQGETYQRLQQRIVVLLFFAITINILDRQVLSLAAPVLRDQFDISNTQYGIIVFAFLLGMAIGQIPAGTLLDRVGARRGLAFLILWWSASNLAHAFMRSVLQFSAMRFLLGIGECGNYSAGIKVIGQWFPVKHRALAAGFFNGGSLAGAILAPPLVTFLLLRYGWRSAFLLPSIAGALWVIPWLFTYWEPWKHPALRVNGRSVAAAQRIEDLEPQPPTLALLHSSAIWGLILMRAFGAPVSHFYWYWLPEYLKHGRGMSLETIGLTAWLPFLAGGIGNIGGGWLSGALIGLGWDAADARKVLLTGATIACVPAVLVPLAGGPVSALALISVASLAINAYAVNLVSVITDLFPQRLLARVTGMTGVGDNVLSMDAMLLT